MPYPQGAQKPPHKKSNAALNVLLILLLCATAVLFGVYWVWGSLALEVQLCDPECPEPPWPGTWGVTHAVAILGAVSLATSAVSFVTGRGRTGLTGFLAAGCCFGLWVVLITGTI